MKKKFTLYLLPEKLGIFHLHKKASIPDWVKNLSFASITRTDDELSIVCPQDKIKGGVLVQKNWRAFKVKGPLGFSLTGIVSSLSSPLAQEKISIFYISTYQTDYILVEEKNLPKAKKVLNKFCKIIEL